MPTTFIATHYHFNSRTVYCGYSVEKISGQTKILNEVTCLKCLKLLNRRSQGILPRRHNQSSNYRKLHIFRADTNDRAVFLAQCGFKIPMSNLIEAQGAKRCRNCLKNLKGRN